MNKYLLLLLVIFASACSTKPKPKENQNADVQFFQVKSFIDKELQELAKTPYYIYKIEVKNGVQDSMPITLQQVKQYAQEFSNPDITDLSLKKYYDESIFQDQTINSFTISYTTTNKDLEVQNIDVLLQEDAKTVKRIFIRKFHHESDTARMEQLSWRPGQSFEINRILTPANKQEITHRTLVVWNEKQ